MKRMLFAVALSLVAAPLFAADVGVSLTIGEPNFFGHIEFGNTARPDVIYRDPVIVKKQLLHKHVEPIYLRVRPGHEKHWRKHCHEYHACNRPVYFVKDTWYRKRYASHYRKHKHLREDRRHEHRKERSEYRDDRDSDRNYDRDRKRH